MTTTTPRQQHTPKERAEQQLGVAQRLVTRLMEKRDGLAELLSGIEVELAAAEKRLRHRKQNPDLFEDDAQQMSIEDVVEDGPALPEGGEES